MPEIIVISGKGGTGKTSLTAAFAHLAADAVICDLHFSPAHGAEGLEIIEGARRRRPHSAVLLFTGAADERVREEALRRGADEVITKPAPLSRLRDAALRAMKTP